MATDSGGRFIFMMPDQSVQLGINDGTNLVAPLPVEGALNIEVFTSVPFGAPLPTLSPGFQQGVIDPGGTIVDGFLTGDQLQLFDGNYKVTDSITGDNTPALIQLNSGNQTVQGAFADTLIGGSGNQLLLVGRGGESVVGGTGAYTVRGGVDATIVGAADATASTTAQIVSFGAFVVAPSAGNYTIFGGVGTTVTAAAGNANLAITGISPSFIDLTGNTGTVLITSGSNQTVIAGSGATSIFGSGGDSITGGAAGTTYMDGQVGSMILVGGAGGSNTIIGSINPGVPSRPDTILAGGAATLDIQGLGKGDIVDLTGSTGSARVNALTGPAADNAITLGAGPATVFGGVGDTITFGSGNQYVDGSAGAMTIRVGSGGAGVVDTVIGSGGGADTILGGSSSLSYNAQVGGSGDLIDLSGSTGNATVNAFSAGGADTILAGNGSDSVWGGGGDRIGVGNSAGAGGTHLFGHSTNAPGAAIGFGTNDTVVATSYDTVAGTATIDATVAGASSARVTIGGAAGDFDNLTDFIFYQNETDQTNSAIVATSQSTGGGASSIVTLPDGTVMTLLGITQTELQTALTAGTLFQA